MPREADALPPYRHPRFWPVALTILVVVSGLRFAYLWLDDLTRGEAGTFTSRLVNEGTGAVASLLFALPVLYLAWQVTPRRVGWGRATAAHLAAALAYSAAHTTFLWASRSALYPALGLGTFDYGVIPWRYAMELPNDLISYGLYLTGVAGYRLWGELRERERRAAELERSLAQAELQALRLQLQPHFLFNALNTVSSTMYEDPAAADTMVGELAELLRLSLGTARTQEVPLATELDVLARYVSLMRARFGESFTVTVDVPAALGDALVPSLVLQPLVENAARHGNLARLGHGRVTVRARALGGRLRLEVSDDGPGPEPGRDPLAAGLGLSATAERLRLLHGDAARLELGRSEEGFTVTIETPLRRGAPVSSEQPLPELADAHPAG